MCSPHFIGGEKADEQDSPSYVSRIFPATYRANVPNIHYESNAFLIMEELCSDRNHNRGEIF